MKKLFAMAVISFFMISGLTACTSGQRQDVGIGAGAVVGGVAGNVLTGGSAAGTVVGAAVGGVAGNELSK